MATYDGVRYVYGNTITVNGSDMMACFVIDLDSISDTQMKLQIQPKFRVVSVPTASTALSWTGTYGNGSMTIGKYKGVYKVGDCPVLTVTPGFSKTQTLSVEAGGKTTSLTYTFKAPKWAYTPEDLRDMIKIYINDELVYDGSKASGTKYDFAGSFFRNGFIKPGIEMNATVEIDFQEMSDLFYNYYGIIRKKPDGVNFEYVSGAHATEGPDLGPVSLKYEMGTLKDVVGYCGHDAYYDQDAYVNGNFMKDGLMHDGDFTLYFLWNYQVYNKKEAYYKNLAVIALFSTNNIVAIGGKLGILFLYDSDGQLANNQKNKQKVFAYDSEGALKETCLF